MSTCPTCLQEIETVDATFGTRLREARIAEELTREDLAEVLGYQRTSIVTRWESGQLVPKDIEVVETVAAAVSVTPAWLLYGVLEPKLFTDVADALVEYFDSEPVEDDESGEVEGEEVLADNYYPDFNDDESTHTITSGVTRPEILNRIRGES